MATRRKTLNLKVWDTPGGDSFANNRAVDYAHADVILLVYSIDKDSTLEALEPNSDFNI